MVVLDVPEIVMLFMVPERLPEKVAAVNVRPVAVRSVYIVLAIG
jgi:hypothetical protein